MKTFKVVIILLLALLITQPFQWQKAANADSQRLTNAESQILNDEGYGNEDVEYYNSETESANEEALPSQEKSLNNAQS